MPPPHDSSTSPSSTDGRKVRSKNGCVTCRTRKIKCDERRPVCQRCANSPLKCDWLEPGRPLSLRRGPKLAISNTKSQRRLAPTLPATRLDRWYLDAENVCRNEHLQTSKTCTDPILSHRTERSNKSSPQPTLSTSHVPLSNSLQLSADDRAAFLYIPDSILVLTYGKPWKWSCFSYVHTHIASQYSGVMRGFIAVAAMEMRSRELLAAQDGKDSARSIERAQRIGDSATKHYSLALKDLSSLLDQVCRSEGRSNDIDALFAMWFLILKFESYDSGSTETSSVHFDGIRSFLEPYLEGGDASGKKLPFASQPFLLFTLYLDADSASGNANCGQLCTDLLARDANVLISHDNLFRSARSVLPKMWGEVYPVAELLDDLENYRPLRLYHLCQAAKLDLVRLTRSTSHGQQGDTSPKRLWQHIQNFGDEFADILLLAKMVPDSGGKRLMWTVYSAALDFHALQILCLSLYPREDARAVQDSALSQMLAIASKALGEDARQICRFMWSLSIALCKIQGRNDQHWLSVHLDRARVLFANFSGPGSVLQGINH
ncbi:hypothetical protein AK830_g1343 [Neonectria ditissima]|uniref:Zn(2)-C6 fungal-type domain-containing protein n=1 Tax=Neonectria ditissima TaxID=78410 RepID=A0A0P7BJ84_9HYPO|nr:hypothetical protein AK830_g1343 [Neonectria ditissima]